MNLLRKLTVTTAYYASFAALGISMASLGPTVPMLATSTGTSLGTIGVLFTARSLGSLLGSVWGGRIYDHLRGNRIMAAAIVAIAALTALTPSAPGLWLLTFILFLTGAVQGILNIGGNTLLVWLHGRSVGPFMNGLHFFYGVGTFLAPVIFAQAMLRENNLLWTYLFLAVLILPSAAMAFLPSPPPPVTNRAGDNNRLDPLMITLIALIFGLYSGAALAYGGWIYTYALEFRITDAIDAAYLTSVFWGALTVGRLAAIPLTVWIKPYPDPACRFWRRIHQPDCAGHLAALAGSGLSCIRRARIFPGIHLSHNHVVGGSIDAH